MNINEDIRIRGKTYKNERGMLTKIAISQLPGIIYYQFGTRLMLRHNKNLSNSLLVVLDNQQLRS